MKYFILGIIATLAVIYPTATKNMLNSTVDVVHNVVTTAVKEHDKAVPAVPQKPQGEGKVVTNAQ